MPVPLVVIKLRKALGRRSVQPRAVGDENVIASIAIVIKDRDSVAGRLEDVVFAVEASVNVPTGEPTRGRDVMKVRMEHECRARRHGRKGTASERRLELHGLAIISETRML